MPKKRFSAEQTVTLLRQIEVSITVRYRHFEWKIRRGSERNGVPAQPTALFDFSVQLKPSRPAAEDRFTIEGFLLLRR